MAGEPRDTGRGRWSVGAALSAVERLQADRRYRDSRGLFFVEGVRNFVQAVHSSSRITVIVYSDRLCTAPLARKLVRRLRRAGVDTVAVSPEDFRCISRTRQASGVGAIVRQHWLSLEGLSPRAGLCWTVLARVRAPVYFGTLVRTSEAVGAAGFILTGSGIDPFDPNVLRASMGSLLWQRLVRTSDSALRRWLGRHRCCVVGATPDGEEQLHRFAFRPPTVLVLGEGPDRNPAVPLRASRAHPHGRTGRLPEPRRGGLPADVRGLPLRAH